MMIDISEELSILSNALQSRTINISRAEKLIRCSMRPIDMRLLSPTQINLFHEPTDDIYENFPKLFDIFNPSIRPFDKILSPWLKEEAKGLKLGKILKFYIYNKFGDFVDTNI